MSFVVTQIQNKIVNLKMVEGHSFKVWLYEVRVQSGDEHSDIPQLVFFVCNK